MLRTAIAIRHVHFQDLGIFEAVLNGAGYKLHYHDIWVSDFETLDPQEPDLLIVLGGPVGVQETDAYPFLIQERALIRKRLDAGRPLFGICLGAQQISAALGATIVPLPVKAIGFMPLTITKEGFQSPLRHLDGVPVLHWHRDSYETPEQAVSLALTPAGGSQAFSVGTNVLALLFHPEVNVCSDLERWLIGQANIINSTDFDPWRIREDARRYGPLIRRAARTMFAEWITNFTRAAL